MRRRPGLQAALLETCINKAIHVGIEVRRRMLINRGSVSIGSAGSSWPRPNWTLAGRHILVIGSGEMGLLVAQALAAKNSLPCT